jgi:MHS family proline/betaine transporter-like MFS transporter
MLASPSMPVVAGAMALLSLFIGMYPPALLTSITESFPTLLRARSVGFLYAVAVAVFGGSAQYVATWLIGATGSQLAPAWYMSGAMLLGVTCLLALRETAPAKVRGQ